MRQNKSLKESGRKHIPKTKRRQGLESSKGKERNLESKIDFYRKKQMADKKDPSRHRTYDDHDNADGYAQLTSERESKMR